jgi:hypothetical protein
MDTLNQQLNKVNGVPDKYFIDIPTTADPKGGINIRFMSDFISAIDDQVQSLLTSLADLVVWVA